MRIEKMTQEIEALKQHHQHLTSIIEEANRIQVEYQQ